MGQTHTDKIQVIVIDNGNTYIKTISNDLHTYAYIVGGVIDIEEIKGGYMLVRNARPRKHGLPYNCQVNGIVVYGKCFITRSQNGDFTSAKITDLKDIEVDV